MSERYVGYVVVVAEQLCDLEQEVCARMADGWEPLGGVSVSRLHIEWQNERKGYRETTRDDEYAQAMVRRERP